MIVGLHLVACAFLISRAAAAEQKPNYYTLCFWDGFSRWRPEPYNSAVGDIPAELCNAVVYSHVTIDEKRSSIRLTDMELQLDPEAKSYSNSWIYNPIWLLPPNKIFAQMRDLKRRNSKLKLLLAVGGPHDPVEKYWQLFPQVYVWKDITASLIQWLRTYDFDGVVLDFFSGTASLHDTARSWDNAKFIHPFVRQINRDLMAEKESWSITFTLPAFDSTTHHLFDIEKLTMEVNFFLVKTSDCLEFPKCSLLNVTRTMDMTDIDRAELVVMKGAPRQRIVLEIPLSGRTYTATAATSGVHTVFPGHSGPYTKLQGFLAFFEVCSHIKSGWTRERFGEEACSFLKLADQYVAYEDAESVSRKARMVMGRQYRGAAIRSVDLGDYNGMCSEKSHLVKAIRSTLDISNYYVHFYYDPPNTTWWKEVEGKNSTTQLPSTSTPSSEPTRTPLPTGSATQGPPKGTPASSNPHTPFVPFVPSAEEEQTTATKTTSEATTHAASSPEGTWTALSTPNAQSTLTQAAQPTAPPTVATDKGTGPQSATTPSASPGLLDRLLDQFGRFLQGGAGDVSPASTTTPSHSPTTKAEASSASPTTPSTSPGLFNRLLDQFGRFLQGGASDVSPAPPTTQAHSPTTKAETSSSSPTAPSTSPGLFGRLLDQFGRFLQGGAGTVSPAPSTTPSHTPATKVETSSAPPATPSASPGLFDRLLDQFGRLLQGGAGAVSSATPAAVSDFPTTKVEASSVLPVTLSVPTTSEVQTSSGHSFKATDPPTAEVPMSSAQPTTPSVSTTAKVPVSDRRILPSVPPTTKVVAPSVPSTLEVETSSAQPVASAQPPTPNIVASSVQYMSSSVPPTSKVMTPSAQPMTPSAPSTLTDETSSTQPAASSPTTTFDAVASTAQPMTSSVPLTPEVGTSSAHPTTASVPPTPKYPISSIKPMVTSLPPTSKGETSSAQPTTSSQYPTTQVVTSSGPRTTPSESQTPERTTASAPPAPPTTPTYRPAPAVPPATKSEGNICKGVQNNKLLPHESDCTRYYQCVHSTPFLRTCAQGTIFDIRRQTCNWPALANRPECI